MFETFEYFRPMFISITIILIIVFLIILFQKKKVINGFSLIIINGLALTLASQLLWNAGVIVDELNMSGDSISTYLFIVICLLAAVNIMVYIYKSKVK